MELYIIDTDFNRHGFIDDYISIEERLSYDSMGSFTLTIGGNSNYVDLLQINRIIVPSDDLTRGYIIKSREYVDESTKVLTIVAYPLTTVLYDRLIIGQQTFSGTVETILRSLVSGNMISSTNTKRNIYNLVLGNSQGLNVGTGSQEIESNKNLGEYCYELAKKNDISFDIRLDHERKLFLFEVFQGTDRTIEQQVNPAVIFAKDFDNIITQNYVENIVDYKTTAIVTAEYTEDVEVPAVDDKGQDTTRTEQANRQMTVIVNDEATGFDRKEIFVSASDIKKSYDNGTQVVVITDSDYERMLREKGLNTLTDYEHIKTLESVVDPVGSFVYGVDYFLGDKVSIKHDELRLILHTRIISVVKRVDRTGTTLEIAFGSNIPTLIQTIKKKVK